MSELRYDLVHDLWVALAPERSRRPLAGRGASPAGAEAEACPLCPGRENRTPPEITARGRAPEQESDGPGWNLRVLPSPYPALKVEGDLDPRGLGLFDRLRGVGAHELVVDSERHDGHLAHLSPEQVAQWLATLADRVRDLFQDRRLQHALVFKNHGWLAGAQLAHPHSQILALPIVPAQVAVELEQARDHFARKGRCLFCDLLHEELQLQERLVCQNEGCVAFTPYASRYPFEVMVVPRQHQAELNRAGPEALSAVARILREVCRRLGKALEDPAFNLVVRTGPNREAFVRRPGQWDTLPNDYHWHVEILPRLAPRGGQEVGADFFVNPTPPEEAARWLRQAE